MRESNKSLEGEQHMRLEPSAVMAVAVIVAIFSFPPVSFLVTQSAAGVGRNQVSKSLFTAQNHAKRRGAQAKTCHA